MDHSGIEFLPPSPAPLVLRGKPVGWTPLAFLERNETTSTFRVMDAAGKEHAVQLTPRAAAAWIANEPDDTGRPIIAIFATNELVVGTR